MATGRRKANNSSTAARAANQNKRKRRRRGRYTLHYILLLLFVVGTMAALSLTVLFKIESITVVGTDKYPPEDIIRTSGIVVGENLFRIKVPATQQAILTAYPYIESVQVVRKFTRVVEIKVTQLVPAGAVEQGDEILLITKDGKVLERGKMPVPEDTVLIKGVQASGAKPGDYLGEQAQESMIMMEYLFAAMEETGFEKINNIDISDKFNIKIIYEDRLTLELGTEADLPHKLIFLREMIKTKLEPDARGTLDASRAKDGTVIYSKEKDTIIKEAVLPDMPEDSEQKEDLTDIGQASASN